MLSDTTDLVHQQLCQAGVVYMAYHLLRYTVHHCIAWVCQVHWYLLMVNPKLKTVVRQMLG